MSVTGVRSRTVDTIPVAVREEAAVGIPPLAESTGASPFAHPDVSPARPQRKAEETAAKQDDRVVRILDLRNERAFESTISR
jgi:hypothetical protein